MTGIYKITSPSGKVYIGESKNIEKRWSHYKTLDCKKQRRLYYSYKKYGFDTHTHEVLLECSFEDLLYFESYFQEIYLSVEKGLNLKRTLKEYKKQILSEETRLKMSKAKKGEKNPFYRKKHSEESKIKNSKSQKKLYENGYINPMKGKKASEETLEKMSNLMKVKYKNGLINPMTGNFHSEESKNKMSETRKKRYRNGDIQVWNKGIKRTDINGGKHGRAKKVINLENGFIYDCAKEAYRSSGVKYNESYFRSMLNGNSKNNTNYEYIDNIEN